MGVSVQGSLCPVVSLSKGGLCPGGLCPRGLCLGSLSSGLCLGVSVQGSLCPVVSLSKGGLCPRGVSVQGVSVRDTPWTETQLVGTRDQRQTPPEGTRDQAGSEEATPHRDLCEQSPLPVNRMTDRQV